MEITRREVIASISIVATMLLIGVLISGKISDRQMDLNEKYYKATEIENQELLKYGMTTNIGNAFVYGELQAIDTVGYAEITNKYLYIQKIKERYTMHTRTVTSTVNGETTTRTETYWTWDTVDREHLQSKRVKFCGIEFNSSQFNIPSGDYIKTIKESSHIRYKYYGYPVKTKGTIFTKLSNGNIDKKGVPFYRNKTIAETVEYLTSSITMVVFWVFWIILIIISVYGFYYLENRWLEN